MYVNDLTDKLTIDHLLYADDVKLIVPSKQADALQSSLGTSSKKSDDLELIPSPSKCEHLPVGAYFLSCYILLNIPHITRRIAHSDGQLCP